MTHFKHLWQLPPNLQILKYPINKFSNTPIKWPIKQLFQVSRISKNNQWLVTTQSNTEAKQTIIIPWEVQQKYQSTYSTSSTWIMNSKVRKSYYHYRALNLCLHYPCQLSFTRSRCPQIISDCRTKAQSVTGYISLQHTLACISTILNNSYHNDFYH